MAKQGILLNSKTATSLVTRTADNSAVLTLSHKKRTGTRPVPFLVELSYILVYDESVVDKDNLRKKREYRRLSPRANR